MHRMSSKHYFTGNTLFFGEYFEAADVDNSGNIESTDYLRIKKYMSGVVDLYGN